MKIKAILAIDNQNGIGKNNNLPWPKISEDMKFFKETTLNNIIVMGRKTYESMGSKILKNRFNIILTSSVYDEVCFIGENEAHCSSLENALKIDSYLPPFDNKFYSYQDIFIIGGAKIYNELFNNIEKYELDEIYLTKINNNYNCDTFVKLPDSNKFNINIIKKFKSEEGIDCVIEHWIKK